MPITPFHFGPGFLFSEITARYISFPLFIIIQIVIDFESAYNLIMGNYPIHQAAHTFLGNTVLTIVISFIFYFAEERIMVVRFLSGFTHRKIIVTTLTASFSHTFFDSIMHHDAHPFSPFSEKNPFLEMISISVLHDFCLYSALFGLTIFIFRKLRSRKKSNV